MCRSSTVNNVVFNLAAGERIQVCDSEENDYKVRLI